MKASLKKIQAYFQSNSDGIYVYVVIGTTIAIVIFGVFVFGLFNSSSDSKDVVSGAERDRILGEMIRNNPLGLFDTEDTFRTWEPSVDFTTTKADEELDLMDVPEEFQEDVIEAPPTYEESLDPAPIPKPKTLIDGTIKLLEVEDVIAPDLDIYNYRYTKSTTTKGPLSEECGYYGSAGGYGYVEDMAQEVVSEYHEYFDRGRSYYKSTRTDQDNEIIYSGLGKYGTTENEFYSYIGGELVAKFMYDINENFSNDYRLEVPSYVSSYPDYYAVSGPEKNYAINSDTYLGENARVTDVFEEDGVMHYVVQSYYYSYCNYVPYEYNDRSKFYMVYTVNADTFAIERVDNYLDEITDNKLIRSEVIESDRQKVAYETVSSTFENSYSAEELVVDYRGYDYNENVAIIEDHFRTTPANLFWTKNKARVNLQYVGGKNLPELVENSFYSRNEGFYADTEKGAMRYANIMAAHKAAPEYTYYLYDSREGYEPDYLNLTVSLFDPSEITLEGVVTTAIDNYLPDYVYREEGFLIIDGQEMNTVKLIHTHPDRVYGTSTNSPVSYSGPTNDPYPLSYTEDIGYPYPVSYVNEIIIPTSYPASYPDTYSKDSTMKVYAVTYIFEARGKIYSVNSYTVNENWLTYEDYTIFVTNDPSIESFIDSFLDDMWTDHYYGGPHMYY